MRYRDSNVIPQHKIWALSNAERIIHSVRQLANPILSYNLVTLMRSIIEWGYTPQDVLETGRIQLLNTIQWQNIPDAEKKLIIPSVVRELLTHNKAVPQQMLQHLEPEYADIVTAHKFALMLRDSDNSKHRQELVDAIANGEEQGIRETFGTLAEDWLRGMRSDLAQHLAKQCLDIENDMDRQRLANTITLFRRAGDAPVPDLAMCRTAGSNIFLQIMPDWIATKEGNLWLSIIFAIIGFFVVGLIWLRVKTIVLQRRILFTSLYALEAKALNLAR
ncbi:hypothetical protein TI03_06005 [Achromatium sp. WMS1]|nr:hypothetical protein TI03_06005 [Achromatium sp. WMS1]